MAAGDSGVVLPNRPVAGIEEPLPTLRAGDVALTSTRLRDGSGVSVQVARRQADGRWLRVLDMSEPSTG